MFFCVQLQSIYNSEINQSSLKIVSTKTTRPSIICANFWKNSKRSKCETQGPGGHWFMKKTWSRKSRVRLPLTLACPLTCPDDVSRPVLAWVQHCIKLPGGGQAARPSQAYYGQKFTVPCLNCHLFTHGGAETRLTLDRASAVIIGRAIKTTFDYETVIRTHISDPVTVAQGLM